MSGQEKLRRLEETFEMEKGTLRADMKLDEVEEWDSMSRLSLIVLMEEKFNKRITRTDVMNYVMVQDILDSMD